MAKFKIYYGLGGGFGGEKFSHIEECKTRAEAEDIAYELAVEEYESYGGHHGLVSEDEIRENPEEFGLDLEEATIEDYWNTYMEEVNSWISYHVEEWDGRPVDEDGMVYDGEE
jgi:hypothetical protein